MTSSQMIRDIAAISEMVNTSKGLTPLVDPIKNKVSMNLDTEYGFVILEERDARNNLLPEFAHENRFPSPQHEQDLQFIHKWMSQRNGTLVIQSIDDVIKINGMTSDWINRLLGFRLITRSSNYGTAFFINRRENVDFSDEEICFARTCVNLMGNSLENYFLVHTLETKFQKLLQLNRMLFLENNRIKSNLEHLGLAVVVTDHRGTINFMNQTAREFFNTTSDNIQQDLFNDPQLYDFSEIINESVESRSIVRERFTTVTGNLKLISVIASPIYSSNKGISGVVVAFDELYENQHDRREVA